jgi:hypothetical protein
MPTTAARRWCIPLAVQWFERQSYDGPLELVVVFSGDGSVDDLLPDDDRIKLVTARGDATLGGKHNLAAAVASHPWLAKWDDDDWQAPRRLEVTMEAARLSGAELVSAAPLIFHELDSGDTWRFDYQLERPWQPGNSLLFSRELWEEVGFDASRNSGIDTAFTWRALEVTTGVTVDDSPVVVVMKHGQTTGIKNWDPKPPEFLPWEGDVEKLMGADLPAFREAWCLGRG